MKFEEVLAQSREGRQGPEANELPDDADDASPEVNRWPPKLKAYFYDGLLSDKGGLGDLYIGRQRMLPDRRVAIKFLSERILRELVPLAKKGAGPTIIGATVRLFWNEAEITADLKSQHVVHIYSRGMAGVRLRGRRGSEKHKWPYFVMELIEGVTLAGWCSGNDCPWSSRQRAIGGATQRFNQLPDDGQLRIFDIFSGIARGLQHAHNKNVIHRDLTPRNVMIDANGDVKIIDWGCAKRVGHSEDSAAVTACELEAAYSLSFDADPSVEKLLVSLGLQQTGKGIVIGSADYAAPEQVRGDHTELIGKQADVYALGGILYLLLTGKEPRNGTRQDMLQQSLDEEHHARICQQLDECGAPEFWRDLAKKCLSPAPSDRFSDAGEVVRLIETWRAERSRREREAKEEAAAQQARAAEALKTRDANRRALWRTRWALVATAVLFIVGGGFGWYWLDQENKEAARNAAAALDETRRIEDVTMRFNEAEKYLELDKVSDATAALERGKGRLGSSGPPELEDRLRKLDSAMRFLLEFEDARFGMLTLGTNQVQRLASAGNVVHVVIDQEKLKSSFAKPFADHGLDLARNTDETVTRIRSSPIRRQIVQYLDSYAIFVHAINRGEGVRLLQLAQQADDNPWRKELRTLFLKDDSAQLEQLATKADTFEQPAVTLWLFALMLQKRGSPAAAEVFRRSLWLYPNDLWLNNDFALHLGTRVADRAARREAVQHLQRATAVRPNSAAILTNLGWVLYETGDLDGAEAACQRAIKLNNLFSPAHLNLGVVLMKKGDLKGAIIALERARELNKSSAEALMNIASVKLLQNRPDEAIPLCREALRLDPRHQGTYCNLANAMTQKGETLAALYNAFVALLIEPNYYVVHYEFGTCFAQMGWFDLAVFELERCVALDPTFVEGYVNLAAAHLGQERYEDAAQACERALALKPLSFQLPTIYGNLAEARRSQNRLPEGRKYAEKALELDKERMETYPTLGLISEKEGQFAKSLQYYKDGLSRMKDGDPRRGLMESNIKRVKPFADCEGTLDGVLQGEIKPKRAVDLLYLSRVCRNRQLYAGQATLFRAYFEASPSSASNLAAQLRFFAARAAALAGCGVGKDASSLTADQRQEWRKQSQRWLRDDLALLKQRLAKKQITEEGVRNTLRQWTTEPDLSCVREITEIMKLPKEEQRDWLQLWTDVVALIQNTETK